MKIKSVALYKTVFSQSELIRDNRAKIVFMGRSNVGKSSLINALCNRKNLARTSSTPGKTQQLNYYRIDGRLYMVDLPGYGFVRGGVDLRARLGQLTKGYLENRETLRAVVQLIDARHDPSALDRAMIEWLRGWQKPFLLVFTKADKLSRSQRRRTFDRLEASGELGGLSYAPFSALTGEGRDDVLAWILEAAQ